MKQEIKEWFSVMLTIGLFVAFIITMAYVSDTFSPSFKEVRNETQNDF